MLGPTTHRPAGKEKAKPSHFTGSIRNKHVFAAFMNFLATANLIKNNIKGHFYEQMGKPHMCRLIQPINPQYKV